MIDDLSRWSLCQVWDHGSEFGIMEYLKTEEVSGFWFFGFWFLVFGFWFGNQIEVMRIDCVMRKKQERRASQR